MLVSLLPKSTAVAETAAPAPSLRSSGLQPRDCLLAGGAARTLGAGLEGGGLLSGTRTSPKPPRGGQLPGDSEHPSELGCARQAAVLIGSCAVLLSSGPAFSCASTRVTESLQCPWELGVISLYKWNTGNESSHTSHTRHNKDLNLKVHPIPSCRRGGLS